MQNATMEKRGDTMDTIEYSPSMWGLKLTEEMNVLKGLPLEEQAKRFRALIREIDWDNIYGERIINQITTSVVPADECRYARKWIVKDAIIVGIVFEDSKGDLVNRFLNDSCTTYFRWDKNGIGGRHFDTYCTLIWRQEPEF